MSTDAEYLVDGVPAPAGRHVCLPHFLDQVRFRFDIKDSSARLLDSQITFLVNRARDKLFRLILEYDDTRLRVQTDLVTQAGVNTVALPARSYATVRLTYTDSDGKQRELKPASYRDGKLGPSADTWSADRPTYYTTPTQLVLVPTPAEVRTLKLLYVAAWVDLEPAPSVNECWDGVQAGWDEWVIWDALVTLAIRSRRPEDLAMFKGERDELTAQFMSAQREDSYEGPTFARKALFQDDGGC